MNIVEHNNNFLTKQPSSIEKYLLRIIQRYFDTQYIETKQSIEAIIVEALTRMKRDILHEKSFVFHINNKTGHVTLTCADIDAEPAFDKKAAFNKDFSSQGVSSPDTICEGNDPRLFDIREPLPHNHDNVLDIVGPTIQSLFNQVRQIQIDDSDHSHTNYNSVLKKLRYTGSMSEIDLAKISMLELNLQNKIDEAIGMYNALPEQADKAMAPFKDIEDKAKEYLQISEDFNRIPPVWYTNAIAHIDSIIKQIKDRYDDARNNAVSPEYLQSFIEQTSNRTMKVLSKNIESIPNSQYIDKREDNTFFSIYSNITTVPEGETIVRVDAYLNYSLKIGEEDVKLQVPLPFVETMQDEMSTLQVFCKWDNRTVTVLVNTIYKPKEISPDCIAFNNELIGVNPYETTRGVIEYSLKEDGISLCTIDSQQKFDTILSLLEPNSLYAFNAHGYFNCVNVSNGWYINDHGIDTPMPFILWDENDPEYTSHDGKRYVYLSTSNNKMISRSVDDFTMVKHIYEYSAKRLTDFLSNPSISLKIYTQKGE